MALPMCFTVLAMLVGIIPPSIENLPHEHVHNMSGSGVTAFSLHLGSKVFFWGRIITGLGMGLVVASIIWPLLNRYRSKTKSERYNGAGLFISIVLALLLSATLVGFLIKAEIVTLTPRSYFKIFEMFGVTLVVSWLLTPILAKLLIRPDGGWIVRLEIKPAVFEEIAHSAVMIGYPLYTIGALFAGAIWAEQAWGSWWGWDPKEVGALIIWLFYTGYLHARYHRKWQGRPAAVLIVLGMVFVFVSFFGNYFFGGLHSFEVT
jgi:MFS family permease